MTAKQQIHIHLTMQSNPYKNNLLSKHSLNKIRLQFIILQQHTEGQLSTAEHKEVQRDMMAKNRLWRKDPVLFTFGAFSFYHHSPDWTSGNQPCIALQEKTRGWWALCACWLNVQQQAQPSRVQWSSNWGLMGAIGAQFVQHVARKSDKCVCLFDKKLCFLVKRHAFFCSLTHNRSQKTNYCSYNRNSLWTITLNKRYQDWS